MLLVGLRPLLDRPLPRVLTALGIRNLVIITGDPPKMGDFPDATAVYLRETVGLRPGARVFPIGEEGLVRRLEVFPSPAHAREVFEPG